MITTKLSLYIDGFAQYSGNSIPNAAELPQYCAKPPIYILWYILHIVAS